MIKFRNTEHAIRYGRAMSQAECELMRARLMDMATSKTRIEEYIRAIEQQHDGLESLIDGLLVLIFQMQFTREAIEARDGNV